MLLEVNKFKHFNPKNNKSPASQVNCVFFTDRKKISQPCQLLNLLPKNSAIIFREYDLSSLERFIQAQKIFNEIKKYPQKNFKFLIGKDFALAMKIKADGIHYSDHDLLTNKNFAKVNLPKKFIFSIALHHPKNCFLLKKFKTNLVFFSPIFQSTSHPSKSGIGVHKFSRLLIKNKYFVNSTNFTPRIFALGGINLSNIKQIRILKIAGFGAIDLFKIYD